MTKSKLVISILISLFFTTNTQAQLGGLLKKKKNKEEKTEVVTNDSIPKTEEETGKKEKKKGGGLLQKVVGKISKVAGNTVMGASGVTAIGNLAEADVIVSMGTNIYSKDLGLMLNDFLGKEWINNGDFTMLQIGSKDAFQFYKYDGVIKVNGKELKHASMGIHTVTENPGTGNKKITFEKAGNIEGSFEIPMPGNKIKLISVNGQTKDAKVDFTKDVVLEFANYSTAPESLIRVDVITTQIGIRTLSLVAYVKPAAKVTIPEAAFRNIENSNNFNFKNSYLSISDQLRVKAINPAGAIPNNQMVITGSNDGMWITVTASKDNSKGIQFNKAGALVEKKNAAQAKPLSFIKNIATSQFYTYGESSQTKEETDALRNLKITSTVSLPYLQNDIMDEELNSLYQSITKVLKEGLNANIMPVNTVTNAACYANTMKFMASDLKSSSDFLISYKGLSPIKNLTSIANMYYGENALVKETKADALLKVSLHFKLSYNKKALITPYLTIELTGESNGDYRSFTGTTKYFSMLLTGNGYEIKENKTTVREDVFQRSNFTQKFKEALQELKAKEETSGDYEKVWNLQK